MERRKLWAYYKNYVDKYKERLQKLLSKGKKCMNSETINGNGFAYIFSHGNFDGR